MMPELVSKNVRNVDPGIRQAIVSEAVSRRITLSDVVCETLAAAWGLEYELSGEITRGIEKSNQLIVRMPQELAGRVYHVSRARQLTESSLVQLILAERFGVAYSPVKRGGATRRRRESV